MNSGIQNKKRFKIAGGISSVLADSYTLYLKTQNYHWNVKGPRFHQLHLMFEDHYTEMAIAIDEIAERIRSLDYKAPGTFKEFLELTSITEETGELKSDEMIKKLIEGHDCISRKSREVSQMAAEANDEATADLLTSRIKTHEKYSWMLRSLLE